MRNSQNQPAPPTKNELDDADFRENPLSEAAKAAVWAELARITPALKPAASRVLTWLTAEAMRRGSLHIRASCRDIAAGSGCNKSKTIPATRDLVNLRLIAKRQGTATREAAYILRYAETLKFSGPLKGPPPNNQWSPKGTTSGPQEGPPNGENGVLFETEPNVLRIDSSALSVIEAFDRSSEDRADKANEAHRNECRGLMMAYVRNRMRNPHAHPPDEKILGVMLRVAEWAMLKGWLEAMIKTKHIDPPENTASPYAWLVTVAINKIHGIPANEQRPTIALMRGGKQFFSKWAAEAKAAEEECAKNAARQAAEWEAEISKSAERKKL